MPYYYAELSDTKTKYGYAFKAKNIDEARITARNEALRIATVPYFVTRIPKDMVTNTVGQYSTPKAFSWTVEED